MSPSNQRWINSTILGVGVASLFSDIGHEMATVALPTLIATLGGGSAVLGVIEGIADGISSFTKLISGHYVDRIPKRKPIAVFGYLLTALGMASFGLATQMWHVFLGRTLGWFGRGIRTPVRKVLLAEATTPETYGKAYGLERSMDSLGAVIGPLFASLTILTFGFRSTFFLTLIPGMLAALSIAFLVKEKPSRKVNEEKSFFKNVKALPSEYKTFLLGVGVAGIGDFSNVLLILWATQAWTPLYGIQKASALAISFYIGFNVIYTMTCYVGGSLADRFPKNLVLATGYVIAIIPAMALLFPGPSFIKFAIVFGFSGLYMGVWETVESTTAASLLPAQLRGIGFGMLETVNGFGDLISSVLVGVLWAFSAKAAMSYVVFTCMIGAILVIKSKPLALK